MNKEENVLNILMYLFHHHMQQGIEIELSSDSLLNELKEHGFHQVTIARALNWLARLSELKKSLSPHNTATYRVFSDEEKIYFSNNCINFILQLRSEKIIPASTLETIIQLLLDLQTNHIDISLIKWVSLLVLYNVPEHEEALSKLELLILDFDQPPTKEEIH